MSAFAKPLILYQNMNVLVDIRNSSNTPMIPTTKQNGLACVGSVSVANFDVLAALKLGREQKKKKEGGGGEERRFPSLLSPSPKTSKFATETLATQAKNGWPSLTYHNCIVICCLKS